MYVELDRATESYPSIGADSGIGKQRTAWRQCISRTNENKYVGQLFRAAAYASSLFSIRDRSEIYTRIDNSCGGDREGFFL